MGGCRRLACGELHGWTGWARILGFGCVVVYPHGRPFTLTLALSHQGRGDCWQLRKCFVKGEGIIGYSVQVLPRKATAAGSTRAARPGPSGMIRCPFSTRSKGSRSVVSPVDFVDGVF